MKKYFFIGMFLLIFSVAKMGYSQSITASYTTETRSFSADQFPIDLFGERESDRYIRIRDTEIIFAGGDSMVSGFDHVAISPNRTFIGVLFFYDGRVSAEIYRSDGSRIHRISHLADLHENDPSRGLYMFDNGTFVYRDNIAGFSYFDEKGARVFQAYNSFGSQEGERVSEMVFTSFGHARFLYNPAIFEASQVNSRIQRLLPDGSTREIAFFEAQTIEAAKVHPEGRLLLVHTVDQNTGTHRGKVVAFDGQIMGSLDYENTEILEQHLSACGQFVTAMASGRVMVFDVLSEERIGSASFRETVRAAGYNGSGMLTVLTGSQQNTNRLQDLRVHMIDIIQRTVNRENIPLELSTLNGHPLSIVFDGSNSCRIIGGNRHIRLRF